MEGTDDWYYSEMNFCDRNVFHSPVWPMLITCYSVFKLDNYTAQLWREDRELNGLFNFNSFFPFFSCLLFQNDYLLKFSIVVNTNDFRVFFQKHSWRDLNGLDLMLVFFMPAWVLPGRISIAFTRSSLGEAHRSRLFLSICPKQNDTKRTGMSTRFFCQVTFANMSRIGNKTAPDTEPRLVVWINYKVWTYKLKLLSIMDRSESTNLLV